MPHAWHRLRAVRGKSTPTRAIFVDCEASIEQVSTNPPVQAHTLRLGVAACCWLTSGEVADTEYFRFKRQEEFWSWLSSRRSRRGATWVFAHNLGYDLTLLGFWDRLGKGDNALKFCVLADPPTVIVVQWGRHVVKYVDTLNYWRLPLRDMGLSVSLPKLPMPAVAAPDSDWFRYCKRDVEIITSCVTKMIHRVSEMSLCSLQMTGASLSWHAYRKCFLAGSVWIHSEKRVKALERAAYYGGRVECFVQGFIPETVVALDAVSLYPCAMKTRLYPNKLLHYTENISRADLRSILGDLEAVAHVSLVTGHIPLPLAGPHGTTYSSGACDTYLAGDELRAAFSAGAVRAVYRAGVYSSADLFSSYVNKFYSLKEEARVRGDPVDELWAKMMLNSLSGKFAQRARRWVNDPREPARADYAYWWVTVPTSATPVRYRSIAGVVQREFAGEEPYNSFPAITACITANSRVILEEFLANAGKSSACYCDTDSVHTLLPGYSSLYKAGYISPGVMGRLREVCRGRTAYYHGPKQYRVGDKIVHSSVKPTAVQVADGVYRQDSFAGIETTLCTQNLSTIYVSEREIRVSSETAAAGKDHAGG